MTGVGIQPAAMAYDSANGFVYVANEGSNNVTVVDPRSNQVVVSGIGVGTAPRALLYDANDGDVYVVNSGSSNVSVIDGSTNRVVVPGIYTGDHPMDLAYDPANHSIFVTNELSGSVSIIDDRNNSVKGTFWCHYTCGPWGIVYDPREGEVVVAQSFNHTLTFFNGSTGLAEVPATVYIGSGPGPLTYDSRNDWVYAQGDGEAVSAYDLAHKETRFLDSPFHSDGGGLYYDPVTDRLWTVNGTFVNSFDPGTGAQIKATAAGEYAAFLGRAGPEGDLYVGDAHPWTTRSSASPNGSSGTLEDVGMLTRAYPVTFRQTGLPPGSTWSLAFENLQLNASTGRVGTLDLVNGSYFYRGGTTPAGTTTLAGPVEVTGAPVTVNVTFGAGADYQALIEESGLPRGDNWQVAALSNWTSAIHAGRIVSGNSSAFGFYLPNGTYRYRASTNVAGYSPVVGIGSLTINGSWRTAFVRFSCPCNAPVVLTFVEQGLAPGLFWEMTVGGMASNDSIAPWPISFSANPGLYTFAVAPVRGYDAAWTGEVLLSSAPRSVVINFTAHEFFVELTETGLPPGLLWAVTLNGTIIPSSYPTLTLSEPNGSYDFGLLRLPGFSSNWSGLVTINGTDVAATIPFTTLIYVPETFTVVFRSEGLPAGTDWGIILGNSTLTSTRSTITVDRLNGTYGYLVLLPPSYTSNASGFVQVNGSDVNVDLRFTLETYLVVFLALGMPAGTNWSVTVSNSTTGFNLTVNSSSNVILFWLPRGMYRIAVHLPNGYAGSPTSNVFVENGESGDQWTFHVSPPRPAAPVTISAPPDTTGRLLAALLGGCLVVIGGLAALLLQRTRGRGSGPGKGASGR